MRYTSPRRRNSVRGARYDGRGYSVPKPEVPALAIDPEDPEAIECPVCHAFVKRLASGLPRSHAWGGFGIAASKGRAPCSGSAVFKDKNVYQRVQEDPAETDGGYPIFGIDRARKDRLINTKIAAERFGLPRTLVDGWIKKGQFVPHVAYLQVQGVTELQKLFPSDDVDRYFAARGLQRKQRRHA